MGNNREVWLANTGETVQRTQYYPSGLPWAEGTGQESQNKKYNGKEFVEAHGLDEYDSAARWYYPAIMRTTTLDPLAEKYYNISPYAWCLDNPVNRIDPTGMYDLPEVTVTAPAPKNNKNINNFYLWENSFYSFGNNNENTKGIVNNAYFKAPDIFTKINQNVVASQKEGSENSSAKTIKDIGAAIAGAGIAADNLDIFKTTYGGKEIVYVTIKGTEASVKAAKVVSALKGVSNATIVVGFVADVTLSAMGAQSWGKTAVNTGVTIVAVIVGGTISATAGAVIGAGYLLLDQLGAFDRPSVAPNVNREVCPQDNIKFVKPIVIPEVIKPYPKSNITTISSK